MHTPKSLAAKAVFPVALIISLLSVPVHAGIPVIDGGNLTQNVMTAMESVAQTLQQIEQYTTQLQQYENQLQNTAAPAAYIWDQASQTISKLIEAQDMLAYYQRQAGSLDQYLQRYQDVSYYRGSPCFAETGCGATERMRFEENRRITSSSQKQANDALFRGIAQQQKNMVADARQLERLQVAATSADGQVKAIQSASQLAAHQSNQLLQIRALMLAQQSALAVRTQAEADQSSKEQAAHEAAAAARGPSSLPSNPIKW